MPAAPVRCLGQCLGEHAAGVGRVDLRVHHTDVDGGVHPAGDALVEDTTASPVSVVAEANVMVSPVVVTLPAVVMPPGPAEA